MDEQRCATCLYRSVNPHINPDRGTAEFHAIMYACKRRAPVATGGLHSPSMTIWPTVTNADWCGEYRTTAPDREVIAHMAGQEVDA